MWSRTRHLRTGRQLASKPEANPNSLPNPGEMISWDDPEWTYDTMHAHLGLKAAK